MAAGDPVRPSGGDRPDAWGVPLRRKSGSMFTWSAPSPSPAEVAGLEQLFPEVIQLPTAAIDREAEGWTASGLLLRALSRWVPPDAVLREFRRAGLAGRIDLISLAHRTYMVKFELPAARDAALMQPWTVNGQPLAVEVWRPEFIPSEVAVRTALLWIRLPNLPIEFWTVETIRSIVSVAGQFVEIDEFTKERRRGSFARACVRVDLSKPLRPGARFRGHGSPFWQQFAYEHVDGICELCGSLHLAGPCSSSRERSSSVTPLFGPWMAAVRHRKPPLVVVKAGELPGKASSEVKTDQGKPGSSDDQEGWRKPVKPARRRIDPSSSLHNVVIVESETLKGKGPCREQCSVPVTIHSETLKSNAPEAGSELPLHSESVVNPPKAIKGGRKKQSSGSKKEEGVHKDSVFLFKAKHSDDQAEKVKMNCIPVAQDEIPSVHPGTQQLRERKIAMNPFTLMGSDRWAGCSKSREDANPVSSKRARAVVDAMPRVSPRAMRGKSRGVTSGNGPSLIAELPVAAGPLQDTDVHEAALSGLKKALDDSQQAVGGEGPHTSDQSDDVPMESSQQLALLDQAVCQLTEQEIQVQSPDLGEDVDMEVGGALSGP